MERWRSSEEPELEGLEKTGYQEELEGEREVEKEVKGEQVVRPQIEGEEDTIS